MGALLGGTLRRLLLHTDAALARLVLRIADQQLAEVPPVLSCQLPIETLPIPPAHALQHFGGVLLAGPQQADRLAAKQQRRFEYLAYLEFHARPHQFDGMGPIE